MTGKLPAPGLKLMRRSNGRTDCYWVAPPHAVKKGYPLKTARLRGDPDNPADFIQMTDHCNRLQAEMLLWLDGNTAVGSAFERNTIGWICEAFEVDEDSPFRETRHATQLFYARYLKVIKETIGKKQMAGVIGKDLRRWHKEWLSAMGARSAYGCIQTLRRALAYGAGDLGEPQCATLVAMFSNIRFSAPKARTARPTYQHIVALRNAALEAGRPSIAIAVTLQFDLGLRQKDVIGEWVPGAGGIERRGRRWQMGLTWDHIDNDWMLRKPTSKSNGEMIAMHNITDSPDSLAVLQSVPANRRIGPVVIDEDSGKPYSASRFSRKFREIADKAKWPKGLFNMDSRAGAVSEAFEAGASTEDVMKVATHKQASTTMIYNRGTIIQSSRVAQLRAAKRQNQN